MQVTELKARVDQYRAQLHQQSGCAVRFSETGPVGMALIDALVEAVDALEKRVTDLEHRPATAGRTTI